MNRNISFGWEAGERITSKWFS